MNKYLCKLLHKKYWNPDERVIRYWSYDKNNLPRIEEHTIGGRHWKCSKCGEIRDRIFGV